MKVAPLLLAGCVGLLALSIAGCVEREVEVRTEVVRVDHPPPPPQREVIPPPPGPPEVFVWQPGHWRWSGRAYFWQPGHWQQRPEHVSEWIPPHWDERNGGFFFVEGHWR